MASVKDVTDATFKKDVLELDRARAWSTSGRRGAAPVEWCRRWSKSWRATSPAR